MLYVPPWIEMRHKVTHISDILQMITITLAVKHKGRIITKNLQFQISQQCPIAESVSIYDQKVYTNNTNMKVITKPAVFRPADSNIFIITFSLRTRYVYQWDRIIRLVHMESICVQCLRKCRVCLLLWLVERN